MKITAPQIVTAMALLAGGCSILVTADRTKIKDDLYMPSTFPEAGTDSGGMAGSAGGAGAPNTSDAAPDTGEASTEDASLEDAAGDAAVSSDAAPEGGEAAPPRDGGDAAARDGGDAAVTDVGVPADVVDGTADTGG